MKPLVITAARLKRWGMCGDGVDEFARQFPRGLTLKSAIFPDLPPAIDSMKWGALVQVLQGKALQGYIGAVGAARATYIARRRAALVMSLVVMNEKGELPR